MLIIFMEQEYWIASGSQGKGPAAALFWPKTSLFLKGIAQMPLRMWKAVCLALVPIIGLGVLLSLKPITLAAPAKSAVSLSAVGVRVLDDAPQTSSTSKKSDKLPSAGIEQGDVIKSVQVEAIRITPVETPPPSSTKSEPKAREITHWHWHVGSKIKRRAAVQD
jgi:hypothetical protein